MTETGFPGSEVASQFADGLARHKAGRLAEAEAIYRRVLARAPDHFDSLHLLGVIFHQRGHHAEAIRQIDLALQRNPRGDFAVNERGGASVERKRYADAHYNRGNAFYELRRFEEALASYDQALTVRSGYAEALSNRGNTLKELKRLEEALASYDRALAVQPDLTEALLNRGATLDELKRFDEALASYDRALAAEPDLAEALLNRGNTLYELQRFDDALASYDRALTLQPDLVEALSNRGNTLKELKRLDEALASFDRALTVQPDLAAALSNRGNTLKELKRFDEALASYDRALALQPGYAQAHYNRGNVLQELKRPEEALASYDRALELLPDYAEALANRGNTLKELQRFEDALASYDRALTLEPNHPEVHFNRGASLQLLKRFEEALSSYDHALALRPDYAEVYLNRGEALRDQGDWADAIKQYDRALILRPNFVEAQFGLCMAQLPVLYTNESEIAERRAAYRDSLRTLCETFDQRRIIGDWANAIGSSQPFLLAYQGLNDRDLQSRYGSLACRIMSERYPPATLSPPPRFDEPVRLGVVSGFFWLHSNWKMRINGWLRRIDRQRFQIFCYHTGARRDNVTREAMTLCDRFVQGPLSVDQWRQAILDDAPHVLIYPEVGMHPISVQLAAQRLAPVQCNSWGHPVTSGLPTMDYFLSSELMEPAGAQNHYTEKLVLLPNLSVYYLPLELKPAAMSRAELGLRSTATVYWCGQSLFKYLPQFDQVFPRIARTAGDCQFAFIHHQNGSHVTDQFRSRLGKAFAAFGLRSADYCVFWPRLDVHRFGAAIGQCDIVLDSIGWSGCNTSLESLRYNLPIVTINGPLMRSRHTLAILKMMGVEETITETMADYISTAVRLAHDRQWRAAVSLRMSANKHRVYGDSTAIDALQEFINAAVRPIAGPC